MCLNQIVRVGGNPTPFFQHRKKCSCIELLVYCIPWEIGRHGWKATKETRVGVIKEKYFLNTSKELLFPKLNGKVSKIHYLDVQSGANKRE